MSTLGLRLLANVIASGNISDFRQVESEQLKPTELDVFSYTEKHILSFGAIPGADTVLDKTGITLPSSTEPFSFYLDEVQKRYLTGHVNQTMMQVQESIVGKAPLEALTIMADAVSMLMQKKSGKSLLDFRDAQETMRLWHKKKILTGYFGIKSGWPYLDNRMGGLEPGDLMTIVGRPAQGKAQPLDSNILTMSGYVELGNLEVGTHVASVDGKTSTVVGIYPQGEKKVYRFTFEDGREAEAHGMHLWEVYSSNWANGQIHTTKSIMDMLRNPLYSDNLAIRLYSGEYGFDSYLLDPFLLGALLGSKAQCLFTNDDGPLNGALSSMMLFGKENSEKFIPPEYFTYSYRSRLSLLRGILSEASSLDSPTLAGVLSEDLALDIVTLARSIGAKAWLWKGMSDPIWYIQISTFDDRILDVYSECEGWFAPFRHPRMLNIKSVKYSRTVECACITVDHPSHLYVTDNYVVTHNTFLLLNMAQHAWMYQDKVPLIVTPEMKPMKLMERLTAMYTHSELTPIANAEMSPQHFQKKILSKMDGLKSGKFPFWIIDGAACQTIEDLYLLARQLKPDVIYYDGAYLMKHKNKRLDKWARIADSAAGLKDVASSLDIPVVASYQFSKNTKKKKEKDASALPTLDDIYGSDEIAQLSSIILGLLDEETIDKAVVKDCSLLKGRGGEKGKFPINWDFFNMDFSEVKALPDNNLAASDHGQPLSGEEDSQKPEDLKFV